MKTIKDRMTGKRVFGRILLPLFLVLVLALGALAGCKKNDPSRGNDAETITNGRILEGLEGTLKAAIPESLKGAAKEFTAKITVDPSKMGSLFGASADEVTSAIGDTVLLLTGKDKKFSLSVSAKVMGVSMKAAELFASTDEIAVKSSLLLGKNAYGVSLKDLADNLPGSFLNPSNKSEYSFLDIPTYSIVQAAAPVVVDALKIDYDALYKSFKEALTSAVDRQNATTNTWEKKTVFETEHDVKKTVISLNKEQLLAVVSEIFDWVEKDAEAKKLLDALKDAGVDVSEKLNELKDDLEEAKTNDQDVTAELTAYLAKDSGNLLSLDVKLAASAPATEEEPASSELIEMHYDFEVTDSSVRVEGFESQTMTGGADSEDAENAKSLPDSMSFTFQWDKNTGDVKATSTEDEEETVITAKVTAIDGGLKIEPQKVTIPYTTTTFDPYTGAPTFKTEKRSMDCSFLVIELTKGASDITIPSFKEILKLSDEELGSMIGSILSFFGGDE